MSTISICTRDMRFNTSWGNYEPPEYQDYLTCDRCYDDDSEISVNDELYKISWKPDFHVCEDCIEEFLNDEYNDLEGVCPECDMVFNDKDLFTEHMLHDHLELEGI